MGDNEARRADSQVPATDRSGWKQPDRHLCQSEKCQAPIRWARTTTGKLMPLDPDPHPDGNIELTDAGAVVHADGQMMFDTGPRYMPHWATCTDPREFKRRSSPRNQ